MREYETTFIIQPEISEEGIQTICGRLEGILDTNGATKLFYDDMGRRRLAYEIKKFQKGHYLTLFYLDEGKTVPEIERALRLDDSILRYLTVLASPSVTDVEARKAEAVELERIRAEKAAEKAAREAEEAAARAAEEKARAVEEAARAKERAEAPAEEHAEAPAEERAEAPAEERAEAPAEKRAEAPAEKRAEAPAEERAEAPAEQGAATPVKDDAEAKGQEG